MQDDSEVNGCRVTGLSFGDVFEEVEKLEEKAWMVKSMSPSTRRYKEAVKQGQQDAYSGKYNPPKHFDKRQLRLYDKHYNETKNTCEQFDLESESFANAYGFTYVKDINGKFKLEKLD